MIDYVFDTEEIALEAEKAISKIAGYPMPGTIRWAIPKNRIDGKWTFPCLYSDIEEACSQDDINSFNESFPYTKEEHDESQYSITLQEE